MPGMLAPGYSGVVTNPADPPGYGRAKQRIGQETGAALKTLREQMAYRGIGGSGLEGQGADRIIMHGQDELGGVNSQLASEEAGRNFQREEADKQQRLSAAQSGLTAAMSVQDRPNPVGGIEGMGHEHDNAVHAALEQLRALTGYSGRGVAFGGY